MLENDPTKRIAFLDLKELVAGTDVLFRRCESAAAPSPVSVILEEEGLSWNVRQTCCCEEWRRQKEGGSVRENDSSGGLVLLHSSLDRLYLKFAACCPFSCAINHSL